MIEGTPDQHPAPWDFLGHVAAAPDSYAVRDPVSSRQRTYAELDQRSRQLADAIYNAGLRERDVVLICMENGFACFDAVWAAQRSGLYYVTASPRATSSELRYLLSDSSAKAVIGGLEQARTLAEAARGLGEIRLRLVDGPETEDFESIEEAVMRRSRGVQRREIEGRHMPYTSGTTGRPKGVRLPITGVAFSDFVTYMAAEFVEWGYGDKTVFAGPAPFYHSACVWLNTIVQRFGGCCLVGQQFDPREFLALIERERVTHAYVVPTMIKRLLDLPEKDRAAFDLSSLVHVIHMAAPCPIELKRQAIEWLGPILVDLYGGSEENGATAIDSNEWLMHPGSVGRARFGEVHILGPDGETLPAGLVGDVYFSGGNTFEYHNDPSKTRAAYDLHGRSTLGDVGYLDGDGYLYLTDRKAFTIITGGVNVYPVEVEEALRAHPAVADAAVFGLPDEDLGQRVHAVVELDGRKEPTVALEQELIAHCRTQLSGVKCPRRIEFVAQLPRDQNGKLSKTALIEARR